MKADLVAAPVVERLGVAAARGVVLGGSAAAVYVSVPGFVIALTSPGTPLMPNGVAVAEPLPGPVARFAGGAPVAGAGRLRLAGCSVEWELAGTRVWEPRPRFAAGTPGAVTALGASLLESLGVEATLRPGALAAAFGAAGVPLARDPGGRTAIAGLLESVLHRDAVAAQRASMQLAGRGGGLTPEGDDLLSACALAVAVLGPAVGDFPAARRQAWLTALRGGSTARTTTALSRTLLELACEGRVAEPLHGLVSERPRSAGWRAALDRLGQVGSATGLIYGLGLGAAAMLLTRDIESFAARGGSTKEAARC